MSAEDMSSSINELLPKVFFGPVMKRHRTNEKSFILFCVFLIVWSFLAIYCSLYADPDLFLQRETAQVENIVKDVMTNIQKAYSEIVITFLFTIVVSLGVILMFRECGDVMVWMILGLVTVSFFIVTLILWILYKYESEVNENSSTNQSNDVLIIAIIWTVVAVIIPYAIFKIREKIEMVVCFFNEAIKVIAGIPLILIQPLLTLITLTISLGLGIYFLIIIESSGHLKQNEKGEIVYEKDFIMQFARGYNIIVMIWLTQFFIDCQRMVIAGATASWYFTREKRSIQNAIYNSYGYLIKYHLGSVALGSLLILLFKIPRLIFHLTKLTNRSFIGVLFRCLFKLVEDFFSFLSKNAYIEIAIFGESFWTSGKRAFCMLIDNLGKFVAITYIGNLILFLGRCMIIIPCTGFGFFLLQYRPEIQDIGWPLLLTGIIATIVSTVIISTFEMILDTIFICFCEDCEMNDGGERPYFMSQELTTFINTERKKYRIGHSPAV